MTSPENPVETPTRAEVISDGIAWTARWSGRWVLIALGLVLVGYLVQFTWVVILPVVLAMILTTVLERPSRFLERALKLPAGLAAGITMLGSVAVLVGVGFALAPSVAGQSGQIVDDATEGIQQLQDWVQQGDFLTQDQIDQALQALQDRVSSSGGEIATGVLSGVSAATSFVTTLVVALILTFLFLKDGRRFLPWLQRATGDTAGRHVREVLGRAWTTLGGYIRTQALVSFIDAVLIGAGLLIVGVPLAIPLAVLTFFAGFIPIVGAFLAGVVAVLVALVSEGPTGALIILAVVVAVQQIEGNVLSPWLQSKQMQLHAAVVLLGVTLGGTLFGIIGAFLAVPTVAVLAVVLRYVDEQILLRSTPVVGPEITAAAGLPPDPEKHDATPGPDSDKA